MKEEKKFSGIGVSPGIVRATAIVRGHSFDEPVTYRVSEADLANERNRFEHALVETRRQIVSLQNQVRSSGGSENASIFDAHLLVLEDHAVIEQVLTKMEEEKINVEAAFYSVFAGYMESLRRIADPYLRERAVDIQDVARRVLTNLKPGGSPEKPSEPAMSRPHIVVSPDLTPGDTAGMDRSIVRGFATEMGSSTSHTAIIARSLNIPAVVGLHEVDVHTGDELLLDGYNGLLIVNPSPETIEHYAEFETEKDELLHSLETLTDEPAETQDSFRIVLSCNIEFASEMESVRRLGGEGVGLYRTEFNYLNRVLLPDEDELTEDYSQVAREAQPHGVIIRTLDAGGDKLPGSTHFVPEANPFLGWRGIRVCLEETELFHTQLRAILRASNEGRVSLLFPMVTGVDQMREAKKRVEEAKESLRSDGIGFDEEIQIGVMIEVPSAAMMADSPGEGGRLLQRRYERSGTIHDRGRSRK